MRTVLGIDPGYDRMGYGFISVSPHEDRMVSFGCLTTSRDLPFADRLLELSRGLDELLAAQRPDYAGVEKLYFGTNAKTAMDVGQARGIIILALKEHHIPFVELTPLQIKLATVGYGKADKKQVQSMVKLLLKLKEIPRPDDAADALAIALCASRYGAPLA